MNLGPSKQPPQPIAPKDEPRYVRMANGTWIYDPPPTPPDPDIVRYRYHTGIGMPRKPKDTSIGYTAGGFDWPPLWQIWAMFWTTVSVAMAALMLLGRLR